MIVHAPDSGYSKEMRSWEAHHSQYGPGGRPYVFQPLPARLYKAVRKADGSREFEAQTAHTETEQRNLQSRGFVVGGQQAALDALAADEQQHALLAAERNFEVRRMSDGAQREVSHVEAEAGARHLPMIPEKPRRGRKPKQPVV